MAWYPKEKEIEAMLGAEGKKRYEYFIHRVCDTRKIWGLYDGGWASLGDGDKKLVPLWPHEAFASRFRKADWSAYIPKEIELGVFLDRWIPGMRSDGSAPAIFPVGSGSSILVSLDDFVTGHFKTSQSGSNQNQPPERGRDGESLEEGGQV